jgi:hypothetical protein
MKEIMAHIIIIMLFEIETFLIAKWKMDLRLNLLHQKVHFTPMATFGDLGCVCVGGGVRMNMGQQTLLIKRTLKTCCGKRIIFFQCTLNILSMLWN